MINTVKNNYIHDPHVPSAEFIHYILFVFGCAMQPVGS